MSVTMPAAASVPAARAGPRLDEPRDGAGVGDRSGDRRETERISAPTRGWRVRPDQAVLIWIDARNRMLHVPSGKIAARPFRKLSKAAR